MQPLVRDLKSLEEGVDGIKAGIVAYCGDNLEIHDLGMFQRHFSSGYTCHYCHVSHRYFPANSKMGRYYAQIISANKPEARRLNFQHFKGTP